MSKNVIPWEPGQVVTTNMIYVTKVGERFYVVIEQCNPKAFFCRGNKPANDITALIQQNTVTA